MIYRNKYFNLDTASRVVLDENGKELRITGNAYRVLVFLCENGHASVTQLGNYLDHAKDFEENHIRQYRYKINTIIGHNIIEYSNNLYRLTEPVEKDAKPTETVSNTDLLRPADVEFKEQHKVENMKTSKIIRFSKVPAIIASILLIMSLFHWPYGYYTFVKVVVTGVAIYYSYYLHSTSKHLGSWFWCLIITAVLFNPIFPIYLYNKTTWGIIDVIVTLFLFTFIIKFRNSHNTITEGSKEKTEIL